MKGFVGIVILVVCVFGLYKCNQTDNKNNAMILPLMQKNGNGFIALPDNVKTFDTDAVVIYAPINCPYATSRRAEEIANYLKDQNIPYIRTNRFVITATDTQITKKQWAAFNEKLVAILKQPGPKVFIKNKFVVDPLVSDIISEYKGM